MNILVTGNLGYIGSVLTENLKKENYTVTGYDIGYFSDTNLIEIPKTIIRQIKKDIRDISEEDLNGVDHVIHLSALSNDPLGEFHKNITNEINYSSTVKFAKICKRRKVKRFIYVSSQSMYGISKTDEELDEYNSEKNPVTEYAKTKWLAEQELFKMNSDEFTVVSFRPSTVFGVSPRLRCDIVFNNLVACAYTTGKIEIKSDGTPWRPVVHIQDVCSAIISGIKAPIEIVSGQSYNVGIKNGNYTVKEMAEAAQKVVPGCKLSFTGEHLKDPRTYKVSFNKILGELKNFYTPKWNLEKGGIELVNFFKEINFNEEDFRGYKTNRLMCLKKNIPKKYSFDLREIN